jgi:hypothetical protein
MMNVTDEVGTPVFTLRFSADDHQKKARAV